jgi:Pyruvate phosphate dikinase, AMP/ATP-binding domain
LVQPPAIIPFDRHFFTGKEKFTSIGRGQLGGKAHGLAVMKDIIESRLAPSFRPDIEVVVPTLTVITTEFFDLFVRENNLHEAAYAGLRDDLIAHAFQKADLPAPLVGDLRALIAQVQSPLAIRSSSLLEDAMFEPFASVYATKMIPNNQMDTDARFRKLCEAIKFIYASTFFREAKNYIQATRHTAADEKMAVIIQEVAGARHGLRFYPHLSGVARSYNFYPLGNAKPADGVIDLALGLGKTIVDDGVAWSYSPAYPQANPPYNNLEDFLGQTQSEFWAVNMGWPLEFNPIKETEYLMKFGLEDAERDGALQFLASTYRAQDDKIVYGIAEKGPRVVDFAPILKFDLIPLNRLLRTLLKICEETLQKMVEVEFAVTLDERRGRPARFGFLQVRPMVVSEATVDLPPAELSAPNVLAASETALGNGLLENIRDIVFVKPEKFNVHHSALVASELELLNHRLRMSDCPYLLIGFGRWGTSDPQAGIPVNFGQISGAKVIIESALPETSAMLSQGSHFFHNITSFKVFYFSLNPEDKYRVDWDWLKNQPVVQETDFVRHVRLSAPLTIKVDGRTSRGVITHG